MGGYDSSALHHTAFFSRVGRLLAILWRRHGDTNQNEVEQGESHGDGLEDVRLIRGVGVSKDKNQ